MRAKSHQPLLCGGRFSWLRGSWVTAAVVLTLRSCWVPDSDRSHRGEVVLASPNDLEAFHRVFLNSHAETEAPVRCTSLLGEVPTWLQGTLVRNGGARFHFNADEEKDSTSSNGRVVQSWLDGFAKIEQWTIPGLSSDQNSITFQAKFLRTDWYNRSLTSEDVAPCTGLLGAVKPPFDLKKGQVPPAADNDNINPWKYNDNVLIAMGEYRQGPDWQLAQEDLSTLSFSFGDWRPQGIQSPHPQQPIHQPNISFGVTLNAVPTSLQGYKLCLVQIDGSGVGGNPMRLVRENYACTYARSLTMFHSFAMTAQFIILLEFPLAMHAFIGTYKDLPYANATSWNPSRPTRAHIFKINQAERNGLGNRLRSATLVQTWSMPTTRWCGHVLNSYEEVVTETPHHEVDIITDWECTDSAYDFFDFAMNDPMPHTLRSEYRPDADPSVTRFRFRVRIHDISNSFQILSGGVEQQFSRRVLIPSPGAGAHSSLGKEYFYLFGRFNYDFRGKMYCYIYENGLEETAKEFVIMKSNLCLSSTSPLDEHNRPAIITHIWYEEAQIPSEPLFVPRPETSAEDDGVVLVNVFDGWQNKSYLLILDGATLQVVDKVYGPFRNMYGFHGRFFDPVRQASY